MEEHMRRRRGSLVGPLILIAFGLIFLLNNLGFLSWSVWEVIFRLWPILLIAIGLDLLLRSRWGAGGWATAVSVAILVALLSVAGFAAWLLAPQSIFGEGLYDQSFGVKPRVTGLALGGALRSESINQPLGNADSAEVELNLGVGTMNVAAMDRPDGLIEGTLILQENERVSQDLRVVGNTAQFRLHNETLSVFHGDGPYRGDDRQWDLWLNPEVPMKLKIAGGVGKVDLDLSRLRLSSLELHAGVSKTDLVLPRSGQLQATVEGGIGKLSVQVPRGMAARLQVEQGLTSVDVMGNYRRQGNVYVSPGYEGARNRVDLILKGGIGKITVQEYDVQ